MAGSRRKFSEEFKRESVALSYSSGKTIDEVANDLGISRSILVRWRGEVKELGERAFPGHGVLETDSPGRGEPPVKARAGHRYRGARNLKKGGDHLLKEAEVIFRFIREHTEEFSVERMCRVFDVSRS